MEQRFGIEQVCAVGTYTTLQLKAALTDLSKLYGVSIPTIRSISKRINGLDDKTIEDFLKLACRDGEVKSFVNKYPELINAIFLILGQPKAPSIHACAMMIFPNEKTLYEWCPVKKQKDMIVSEWEGGELDEAGFLKEDILGIEQLDKFTDILNLIEKNTGKRINLYKDIPLNDPEVFEFFKKGWLGDIFHFGAKGLSNYVTKVQPESIEDLIACICLYRPGPMENNYHNEFLLRRSGDRETEFPIGSEEILKDSFGLMLTQEHIMLLCQQLAGFSLQKADDVRKCIDGDELFWTKDGAIKIKDLKLYSKVKVSTLDNNFTVKYNSVNRSFSQGIKECVKLNIQGNNDLICTPDHKILTEVGWLEAKDCVGHYVYKDTTRRYGSLNKPKEELYLMTALLTEGSLGTKNRCNFTNKDRNEIEEFKRCYKVVFDEDCKEYLNNQTDCISLKIKDDNVKQLGLEFVLSDKKKLPDYVFSLNEDCQEYVIAKMIDFDGYVANKRGGFLFGYSSKSFELIRQMEILFSCLGIVTTTNKRSFDEYPENYYDIGSTDIEDCLKIKKILERYSVKFRQFKFDLEDFNLEAQSSYKIPFEIWQPIVKKMIDDSGYTCNELLGKNVLNYGINHKINITRNRLSKILKICGRSKLLESCLRGDFCFRKVISIEEIGKREVYDFSMEFNCVPQAFVGGILVHNCMGKKILEKIKSIRPDFVRGYIDRYSRKGVDEEYANDLWSKMEEFGKYAFNKSHAAAYSINGYNSLWLKVHYPIEFWSVTFSRASKDDYPFYINEIRQSGNIKLNPVDINKSSTNIVADKEDGSLYWSINSVNQVGEKAQEQIIKERGENGPYFSLEEFIDRHNFKNSAVNKSVIENLIYSGAFDVLEQSTSYPNTYRLREYLLNTYRTVHKVKIDKDKDEYELALSKSKTREDWWWQLQQKKRSGFGFFNYEYLVDKYLSDKVDQGVFSDLKNIEEIADSYKIAMIGGYVLEYEEKNSRKGTFARIILESNYEIIKVIIYAEIFDRCKDLVRTSEKNILLVTGRIIWSDFDGCYVLQTLRNSEFVKLTLA